MTHHKCIWLFGNKLTSREFNVHVLLLYSKPYIWCCDIIFIWLLCTVTHHKCIWLFGNKLTSREFNVHGLPLYSKSYISSATTMTGIPSDIPSIEQKFISTISRTRVSKYAFELCSRSICAWYCLHFVTARCRTRTLVNVITVLYFTIVMACLLFIMHGIHYHPILDSWLGR